MSLYKEILEGFTNFHKIQRNTTNFYLFILVYKGILEGFINFNIKHWTIMGKIIINELLFFLHNKFGCVPNEKLQKVILGFYKEAEIDLSRNVLFDIALKCVDEEKLPRQAASKNGPTKLKLQCDNIF